MTQLIQISGVGVGSDAQGAAGGIARGIARDLLAIEFEPKKQQSSQAANSQAANSQAAEPVSRLAIFLYHLAMESLPAGEIERLAEKAVLHDRMGNFRFRSAAIGQLAKGVEEKLIGSKLEAAAQW